MSGIFKCAPAEGMHSAGGPLRVKKDGSTRVIDIHCHLNIPAADAVLRPHAAGSDAMRQFSSPHTDAVNREQFAQIGKKLNSIDEHLTHMDAAGIDIQAISPMPGQLLYVAPPDVGREGARLTNDGIAAAVAKYPGRLCGMGLVPLQEPELAVAEMRRCVKELGLRGIEIPSHVNGRELSAPELRPVLRAAEELGVLLFLHPLGFTHGERLRQHYFNNVLGNPIEAAIAVAHLIFDGVLDSFPGLKICVAHGGGYASHYWGRMDHAWRVRADCREHISKPPSHYLKQLYFDTLVFDPAELRYLVDVYGADHLCLGTDYPFDMSEPDPVGFHAGLAPAERDKIMGGTAARLLGLNQSSAAGELK
ncbi:MAG TPA: amidohydrolase family protein [Steroidobacteraceae bacterium]